MKTRMTNKFMPFQQNKIKPNKRISFVQWATYQGKVKKVAWWA